MDVEVADSKTQGLVSLLSTVAECHVVSIVSVPSYRRLLEEQEGVPARWQSPYLLCFYHALRLVSEYIRRSGFPDQVRVSLTFDRQRGLQQRGRRIFDTLIRGMQLDWRLQFVDDEERVLIQAGDLLAWHYRTACTAGKGLQEAAQEVIARNTLKLAGAVWSEDQIRAWIRFVRPLADGTLS